MISVVQLETVDYATGLRLQQQLVALRKEEKIGDVLLLLEHKPVITLGRNAKAANVDVTFHGPGQVVGYSIFDLRGFPRPFTTSNPSSSRVSRSERDGESRELVSPAHRKHLGAVDFVRCLEDVLMRTCADFAIPTKRVPGLTGVWTDPNSSLSQAPVPQALSSRATAPQALSSRAQSRDLLFTGFSNGDNGPQEAKLAAIGVHISRSVTSHGFALNVNTDLSFFNLIIPCGITSKPVTSMQQQLGHELDLNSVAQSISRNFGVIFQSQILWVDTLDALLGRTVGVPMKVPENLRRIRKEEDTSWA